MNQGIERRKNNRFEWLLSFSMLVVILFVGMPLRAEVLLIEAVEKRSADHAWPKKGMSKNAVEANLGKPEKQFAAVGQPPITRWVYTGFTVYFENSHVIHTVQNQE